MGRVIQAFEQFFADDGSPLALGWLRFTESGTNNTDKNTFADENLSTPNANPLQLDAAGRCPDVFGTGKYRVTSFTNDPEDEDSPGEQIQVKDPVLAETSGAGGGQAGFEAWSNVTTYQLGDIVYYNNVLYRSIIVDNLNNNPAIEDAAWEQVDFLRYWNENITYAADDLVIYSGNLYLSKAGSNLNYQPDERFDFWRPVASGILAVESKTDNYTILLLERDYMFVLGAATLTDKTFTLPLISSSYDGFRVWITNDSDYNLSVTPQGTSSIWLEDPVIIQKGAILGLRYNASLDTWQAFGNAGPILGAQNIGTSTTPAVDIYGNNLILPNIALAADLSLNDDIPIHLGDDDDVSLLFTSATPAFDITSTVAININSSEDVNLNLATGKDFFINVNSVNHWAFDATGPLLPGASNPLADIGSSSAYIDDIYCDTININTFQRINFNTTNDMFVTHSTSTGYVTVNTGDLQLANTDAAGYIYFSTNGGIPLSMGPGVDCVFAGDLSGIVDISLSGDITMTSASTPTIYTTDGLTFDTYGGSITFKTGVTGSFDRWLIETDGDIRPTTTGIYDIGTSVYRIATLFCVTVDQSSDLNLKENVCDTFLGLDFINELRPIAFNFRDEKRTRHGLGAQEVLETLDRCGLTLDDYAGISIDEEKWGLDYTQLIAPIIRAIQEISAKI